MKRAFVILMTFLILLSACGPKPHPTAEPGTLIIDPEIMARGLRFRWI